MLLMVKYRIVFDRDTCIGALNCISPAPEFFEQADDGKVDLKMAKKRADGKFELVIDENDLQKNVEAASSCPVAAISVEKIE